MLPSCDTQYAPNLILQHGSTTYDYDFLGQLISADYANATISDESYTYDSNGNRLTANGDEYTIGANNELTSDSNWTYTYDDEGNRISKTNSTNTERELYTWDYRNRLTSVTKQEFNAETQEWTTVQIVEYAYDYNNVWIRKVLDSNGDGTADSKTIFIPENYQTTVQIDNNTITHHYLWTPNQQDKLLADVTNTEILWSLTDHLGIIRDIIQSTESGVITQAHLIYDAFGNLISGTNPILFGYTGKAFDTSTALQNNINRWYDASIGRWLSTDPIGFEGNDTNLYRYVGNNIWSRIDQFGLDSVLISKTLVSKDSKTLKKIIALGITKAISGFSPELNKMGIVNYLKCGVVEETTYTRVFKIVTKDSNGCTKKTNKKEITKTYKPTKHIKEIEIDFAKLNQQIMVGSYNLINVSIVNFGEIYSKNLYSFASEKDQIRANQICTDKSGLKKYLRD